MKEKLGLYSKAQEPYAEIRRESETMLAYRLGYFLCYHPATT